MQPMPSSPARREEETDVVGALVQLARFEQLAVFLRLTNPPGVARAFGEDPDHAGQESASPRGRPGILVEVPASCDREDRDLSGMPGYQTPDLFLCGLQRQFQIRSLHARNSLWGVDRHASRLNCSAAAPPVHWATRACAGEIARNRSGPLIASGPRAGRRSACVLDSPLGVLDERVDAATQPAESRVR